MCERLLTLWCLIAGCIRSLLARRIFASYTYPFDLLIIQLVLDSTPVHT